MCIRDSSSRSPCGGRRPGGRLRFRGQHGGHACGGLVGSTPGERCQPSGHSDCTDGFTGNVTLKVLEGTAASLFQRVKHASVRDTRSKVGGFLLKPALVSLRDSLDPEEYWGTYLLGVRGLMVICHGSSTRRAIKNALEFAAAAARQKVVGRVEEEIARINGSGV